MYNRFMFGKGPVHHKGFTLIEMIMAISLFSVITVVGLGIVADIYQKSRIERGNTSHVFSVERAFDIMVREIQSGSGYNCNGGGDCSLGGTQLSFTDSQGQQIEYVYREDSESSPGLFRSVDGEESGLILDKKGFEFSNFTFVALGTSVDDLVQPSVRIVVAGDTVDGRSRIPFSLDVFISQRAIDG